MAHEMTAPAVGRWRPFVALIRHLLRKSPETRPESGATDIRHSGRRGRGISGGCPVWRSGRAAEGLWSGRKDALFSGDPVRDKDALAEFVAAYGQMNRWPEINAGGEILTVGADNYPFPIPLEKNSAGQWYFNTAAGKDEILARRIGKDELTAIAACSAVDDEQKYFHMQKQYARSSLAMKVNKTACTGRSGGTAGKPAGRRGDFAKAAGYTNSGDKTAALRWLLLPRTDQTG